LCYALGLNDPCNIVAQPARPGRLRVRALDQKIKFVDDTVPLASCEFVRIEMAAPVAIGVGRYLTQTLLEKE